MKVYENINEFKTEKTVVTVGTFDGVHRGHQKILSLLKSEAEKAGKETLVFTLYPHPRKVLNPESDDLRLLNTLEEKTELLEKAGINHFIIYPFSKEFANLTSSDFIEKILSEKLNVSELITGYDHRFGKDKQGDFSVLKKYAEKSGIKIKKADALNINGKNISSTKIRNALFEGKITEAAECLGYDYFISGKVVKGYGIGKKLGFPTANIEIPEEKLIPASGVYAVKILFESSEYDGMLNIGNKPTVSPGSERTAEVHIFDFSGNIYEKRIRIVFKKFIRKETKFPDIEALKKQLKTDKKVISAFLKGL